MLIDSHCHIPHKKYTKTVDEILKEAHLEDVHRLITIGTSLKENKEVIKISEEYEEIFCTVGVYPHDDKDKSLDEIKTTLESQLRLSEKIVGIGECGIDLSNWEGGRSIDEQIELFKMHIQLAKDYSLPLVIHNRNGDEHVINTLNEVGTEWLVGVAHCYVSSWEVAEKLLEMGFYLSFTAIITYPSGKDILEIVNKVPLDRFLIETDAPYLPPQNLRGQTNYPKYVKIVAEKVAQVKEKTLEEIEEASIKILVNFFLNYVRKICRKT